MEGKKNSKEPKASASVPACRLCAIYHKNVNINRTLFITNFLETHQFERTFSTADPADLAIVSVTQRFRLGVRPQQHRI
jgi:hypothetical protein